MEQGAKKKITIPGTKVSHSNAQLLISSGVPSYDDIIGGGLAVGTIALIEEDAIATYSKVMLQYFLAEGIVCGHSLFVGSDELELQSLVSKLPAVISTDESTVVPKPSSSDDDKMTIAWRYQNLPTSQPKAAKTFGHYYDLTKKMDAETISKADVEYWHYSEEYTAPVYTFKNPAYHNLLESIKVKIDNGGFALTSKVEKRSILRVGLQSLGSPMWLPKGHFTATSSHLRDLDLFLFCLRALLRSAFAVAVVTIPSKIINEDSVARCIHSSDTVIRLQSFTGTELEKNKALSDYHGFFHVVKLSAINSLIPKELGPVDYAFKLRRKKFMIEELHLPPELQESAEREQDEIPSMGCGSSNKHLLEF